MVKPSALAEWLRLEQHSQIWLSRQLGVSVTTASRIVRGAVMPRPETARRIERLTEGRVTVSDLAYAKGTNTPANRADRIRHGRDLMARGASMIATAQEELP